MNFQNDMHLLLYLVGCGLGFRAVDPDIIANISEDQWVDLYRKAQEQGVLSIVFDAVESHIVSANIPKYMRLQWIATICARENNYNTQYKQAVELADYFKKEGIKTTVLKGFAISTYYPKPSHREFGDFDCFLGEDYELGNCVAERIGAKVERDYYRHSHIIYKSQMIENHQFCVCVRGSRIMKSFEKYLRNIMHYEMNYIGDSSLLKPSCDFNALFLTSHAMTHFLVEGIKLRQVCDWAVLLRQEQNNIDWHAFYKWCDDLHYTRFANAITAIVSQYLGLEVANNNIQQDDTYCDEILNDMFQSDTLFNKKYSVWHSRFIGIKNKLSSLWKFHKIYQQLALKSIMIQIYGFVVDRNPKLD